MNKSIVALIILILLTYVANCAFLLNLRRVEAKIDDFGKIRKEIQELKATTSFYGERFLKFEENIGKF